MTDSVISHTLIFSQPFSHAEQQLLTPEAVSFRVSGRTLCTATRSAVIGSPAASAAI